MSNNIININFTSKSKSDSRRNGRVETCHPVPIRTQIGLCYQKEATEPTYNIEDIKTYNAKPAAAAMSVEAYL